MQPFSVEHFLCGPGQGASHIEITARKSVDCSFDLPRSGFVLGEDKLMIGHLHGSTPLGRGAATLAQMLRDQRLHYFSHLRRANRSTEAASPSGVTLAMASCPFAPGIDFDEALRDLRWFIRGIPV